MARIIKKKTKTTRKIRSLSKSRESVPLTKIAPDFVSEATTSTADFIRPILENSFKDCIQKQRLAMHYSLKEVADRLSVREEHLRLLEEEGLNRMLPEVYVYSILKKYCNFLHLDYDQVLNLYKNEVTARKLPGESDYLTSFKIGLVHKINLNYRKLVIGLLLLIVLAFGGYQLDMLMGKPGLIINGISDNMKVMTPFVNISGQVVRTKKLLFNSQEILLDNSQVFQIDNYNLTNGWNILRFEAYNHLGRVTIKEYNIEFTDTTGETTTTTVQ